MKMSSTLEFRPHTAFPFNLMAQYCLCILLVLFPTAVVLGQATLFTGNAFPPSPSIGMWCHMPKVKALYVWDGANWQLARDAVSEATLCGGTLVVTYFAPTSRTEKIAHIDGNFYAIDSVTFCADSFSVFEATKQFFFVNGRSKVLQWMNKTSCDHRPSPQTVQGQVAFCIPLVPTELYAHDCKQLRTWGILGANGSWLIQPQFDGPFRFENGTATVLYYGQRRRINEKGEWVE